MGFGGHSLFVPREHDCRWYRPGQFATKPRCRERAECFSKPPTLAPLAIRKRSVAPERSGLRRLRCQVYLQLGPRSQIVEQSRPLIVSPQWLGAKDSSRARPSAKINPGVVATRATAPPCVTNVNLKPEYCG